MVIRPEASQDQAGLRQVHLAAFAFHPHSRQTEHLIVDELRSASALTLSLVAEQEARILGHVAFSPAPLNGQLAGWYLLGPLGVLPECQRQGIGSALVRAGLDAMRQRAAQGCALVGNPLYYGRFGFRAIPQLVMEGVPPEVFLALPFGATVPEGRIAHHPAFLIEPQPVTPGPKLP